mmetsp:Transcript_8625/g.28800  ORF Transcript_8625/g.28800 Transcript_8625/m.28800 type:complete len:331 (+) Transcript_8625:410-1402(+)
MAMLDGEARFASVCFFASSFRVKFRAPRQLTLVFVRTFVTSFRDVDTTSNPLCNSPPFRAAGGIRGAFITQSAHADGCGFRVFLRDGLSFFSAFGSSFCGLCALLHRNVLQRLILPGLVPGVITDVVVVTARAARVPFVFPCAFATRSTVHRAWNPNPRPAGGGFRGTQGQVLPQPRRELGEANRRGRPFLGRQGNTRRPEVLHENQVVFGNLVVFRTPAVVLRRFLFLSVAVSVFVVSLAVPILLFASLFLLPLPFLPDLQHKLVAHHPEPVHIARRVVPLAVPDLGGSVFGRAYPRGQVAAHVRARRRRQRPRQTKVTKLSLVVPLRD